MDLIEFRKEFIENIKAEAVVTGEGSCASFVASFANYLQEAEVLMDFTASYFEGTGKNNRKLRVDGYAYDEFDSTMTLIIADFDSADKERVLTKTQASVLQERLIYFIDHSLNTTFHREVEMSRPCSDLVDLLRERRGVIRKYQLLIFTTANMSASITKIESPDIDSLSSECQIWDIARLFKVCSSDTGRNVIEIDFREYSKYGIPCLEASSAATDDFKSFLCIVPGILLADIYDQFGSALLEGNVRSFLSTKVAVNKKIQTTILQCPERFFAYNNGISATAMNVKIETTSKGQFLIGATDFQIINGGQTTAVLSNTRFRYKDKANLNNVFVQMKLTVIEKSLDDNTTALVQNISRSSNSQNKVSDADFFSTHPFHVRMERFSQRLFASAVGGMQHETRWFYERARGQYFQKQMHLTSAARNKFLLQNPKNQLITKTDLAKVRNSWKGLPHIVSKGAQTNFAEFAETTEKEWEESGDGLIFNEKYFQESVSLVLLFKFMESMVNKQPWYAQGYRANIITYTIALFHKLIKEQFPSMDLDLMNIWNRQTIPKAVEKILTALSELVYYELTADDRGVENVTQWCKRDACWKRVRDIKYILPRDIETCLVSFEEQKTAEKEAKADQRIITGLDFQTIVCCEITPAQWLNAYKFAIDKRLVSPEEHTALTIAYQIPKKIPNAVQCKKLVQVLERLKEEGFKL